MATDRQIAANRINAQKSTGPRSAAGKTQSAQNARKHGFCSSSFAVAHLEDLDEIVALRHDLIALYRPANSQELWAVERIALHQMSLIRASRLEAGLFTTCLDQALGSGGQPIHPMNQHMAGVGNSEITLGQEHNFAIAESFHRQTRKPHAWLLFLRYQAQAERNYRRAIQELDRLRALRPELEKEETEETEEIPNEPDFPPQPDPNQSDPAPETNPISLHPATLVGQAPWPGSPPRRHRPRIQFPNLAPPIPATRAQTPLDSAPLPPHPKHNDFTRSQQTKNQSPQRFVLSLHFRPKSL
jgi:hypothetical protein